MLSGRDPGDLGIYGFRNRKDHSYTDLVTADNRWLRDVDRVWDILGRDGRRSIVLGVPQTYPPSPVNGELVSCFLTPDPRKDVYTYPAELRDEIQAVIGDYQVDVRNFRGEDRDRVLSEIYDMTAQRFALARHLLTTRAWDFFVMHEIGLDRLQHAFWRYMDPTHRDHEPGHRYADVIEQYYQYLDEEIGSLRELFDGQTTVLVVSDHGSQRMDGAICVNEWLVREGYMTLSERPATQVPFARAPIDWRRTRAWGEGGHYSRLCLNVEGREPDGIVSAAQYEPLRDELIARLEALTDPDGRPIGTRVYRPSDLWATQRGIPPDLVVYFGNLTWRSNGSLGIGSIYNFENDTGPDDANHTAHGIFVMSGPGASGPDRRDELRVMDVAPTILDLFGLPAPRVMTGRSISTFRTTIGSR
jgi:predicted AlkP superfamily phosphohydrolase/phosphomutase